MVAFAIVAKQIAKVGLDFFFPRQCIGCGKIGDFLCQACCLKLPRLLPPLCQKCGKTESTGVLCSSCWGWQSCIDGIRSPFRFEGVVREAVHALKYRNQRVLSQCLAGLMADYLCHTHIPGEVLVPVPLHRRRLRERGYNQASLLARELAKTLGLPFVENVLCRVKDSLPQVKAASVDARHQNVKGAFICQYSDRIKGKSVLVIDDVCTSGATLEACAAALKVAGAVSVWGLTFAREV